MRTALFLAAVFTLFPLQAPAAADSPILPPPQQVSKHVYAWIGPYEGPNAQNRGFRMNMAFVVGKKAVAVIDTGYSEAMAKDMLAHIGKITKAPVKYAINTSSQPHRYFGNEVFRKQGATIIADEAEAKRMAKSGADFASGAARALELPEGAIRAPRAPDRILTQDMSLDLGGVKIDILRFGPTHTPGQLVVSVPGDKLVYAGDILYGGRLLAILPDSHVGSWIKAFDRLKTFGHATFIPGHGKPGKLADFAFPTREYLALLDAHMSQALENGVDLQTAIDTLDQSRFAKLENFEELAGRNASWTYLEKEADFFK